MRIRTLLIATAATALVGCGESASNDDPSGAGAPAATAPAGSPPAWMLASMPNEDPTDVGMAKAGAEEGDEITIVGRIGGSVDPMIEGRAVFTIVDSAVPTCADLKGDNCPTPWDYCCEPRDSLVANSATIQVVDEAGKPLEIDLSEHGFEPMDEVVVVGTVGPRPSDAVLVVKAEKLRRKG